MTHVTSLTNGSKFGHFKADRFNEHNSDWLPVDKPNNLFKKRTYDRSICRDPYFQKLTKLQLS